MSTELDLQTIDDGSVYLAKSKRQEGKFVLAVTQWNPDGRNYDAEVKLTKGDLLSIARASLALIAESEDS